MGEKWYQRAKLIEGCFDGNVSIHDANDKLLKATISEASQLGVGYNTFTGESRTNVLEPCETAPRVESGPRTVFSIKKVETHSDLCRAMEVSASASYSGLFKVEGKAQFCSEQHIEQNSVVLIAAVQVSNGIVERVLPYKPSEEARRMLAENPINWEQFYTRFGDEFIYRYNEGGEFYALYKFSCSSTQDKNALKAQLSGSYGSFHASAEFQSKIESIQTNTQIEVTYFRNGAVDKLPEITPGKIIDYLLDFPSKLDREQGGRPCIYSAQTKDFNVLEGFPYENPYTAGTPYLKNKKNFERYANLFFDIKNIENNFLHIEERFNKFLALPLFHDNKKIFKKIKARLAKLREIKDSIEQGLNAISRGPFRNYKDLPKEYGDEIGDVKTEIDKAVRECENKIQTLYVPVWEYAAAKPLRHYYSTDRNAPNPGYGSDMSKNNIAFHSVREDYPDAVPVYRYAANTPLRCYYSTDENAPNPGYGGGIKKKDIAFYSVRQNTPDAVAVHEYVATEPMRHYYSTNADSSNPGYGKGLTKKHIVFYAIKSP